MFFWSTKRLCRTCADEKARRRIMHWHGTPHDSCHVFEPAFPSPTTMTTAKDRVTYRFFLLQSTTSGYQYIDNDVVEGADNASRDIIAGKARELAEQAGLSMKSEDILLDVYSASTTPFPLATRIITNSLATHVQYPQIRSSWRYREGT